MLVTYLGIVRPADRDALVPLMLMLMLIIALQVGLHRLSLAVTELRAQRYLPRYLLTKYPPHYLAHPTIITKYLI